VATTLQTNAVVFLIFTHPLFSSQLFLAFPQFMKK